MPLKGAYVTDFYKGLPTPKAGTFIAAFKNMTLGDVLASENSDLRQQWEQTLQHIVDTTPEIHDVVGDDGLHFPMLDMDIADASVMSVPFNSILNMAMLMMLCEEARVLGIPRPIVVPWSLAVSDAMVPALQCMDKNIEAIEEYRDFRPYYIDINNVRNELESMRLQHPSGINGHFTKWIAGKTRNTPESAMQGIRMMLQHRAQDLGE